jgi:hypothetical protein
MIVSVLMMTPTASGFSAEVIANQQGVDLYKVKSICRRS